ncbi:trp operon leader peptide [Salmonella enterica]
MSATFALHGWWRTS